MAWHLVVRDTHYPLHVVPLITLNCKHLSGTATAPTTLRLKVAKSHVPTFSPTSLLIKTETWLSFFFLLLPTKNKTTYQKKNKVITRVTILI